MSELLSQLQQLGDGEIDDLSIAHDASEEIVALRLRVAELETMVKVFRGCIETGLTPELMSPCYQKVISLVGRNADDQKERDGDNQ